MLYRNIKGKIQRGEKNDTLLKKPTAFLVCISGAMHRALTTVFIALLVLSFSGCEVPEPESGLTKVNISTDRNGLVHMPNITIPNDGYRVLYVTTEYVSTSGSSNSTVPQSTYKWYKNGNLIDGEQKGSLSIKGPASDIVDFIAVENGDKIKVIVTDRDKTVEAETTISVQ